jgi:prophage antirepressor-like protein
VSDLVVFDFSGRKVRTAGTPEAPLFCAADVCDALGMSDTAKACERLDQDEVEEVASKQPIPNTDARAKGGRRALYVTESGLFSLILTSRKPEARAFKKWVTSEVLPEIRRRGVYSLAEAMERKTLLHECFRALPAKQAPLFNPLIEALRPFARSSVGGSGGTPPWARMISGWIYDWTWKDHKGELRKRNPVKDDGTLDWRDYDTLTDEGRRLVSMTIAMAIFAAKQSYSWADWRDRMETYFLGNQKLPMPDPERRLGGKRRAA